MVSGPYQSKLLRLAIRQYRKGMERHHRVVRQTRDTVVTSAVLGGAWALVSLRTAVRWSQQWKTSLKRAVAAARVEKLSASSVDQSLEDSRKVGGSDAIAQVLSTLKGALSMQQTTAIAGRKTWLLRPFAWLQRSRDVQIVSLASDIETRRIVLILSDASVYKGLDDLQQQRIREEIAQRMEGAVEEVLPKLALSNGLSVVMVAADGAVRSPADSAGLAYSVRAFWVEVLRMVASLRKRRQRRLPVGSRRLRPHSFFWKGLLGYRRERMAVEGSDRQWFPLFSFAATNRSAPDYSIEADVISSSYVEHPLEKLLNWIDKGLLWLEQRWQSLVDWLQKLG